MLFPCSSSIPTLTEVACFKPCHMKVLYLAKKENRGEEDKGVTGTQVKE
jgi:hypothetical protein